MAGAKRGKWTLLERVDALRWHCRCDCGRQGIVYIVKSRSCIRCRRRKTIAPIGERFWQRIEYTPTCWLWTGARFRPTNGRGDYGQVGLDGRLYLAHRLAWILVHGPIPRGLYVCHHCDTPRCVRPEHLFLGTALDNRQDCTRKGRDTRCRAAGPWRRRGENHRSSKLNNDDVRAIRRAVEAGDTDTTIAARFGVARSTIACIRRGTHWAHLP